MTSCDRLDNIRKKPLGTDSSTYRMKNFHLHCVSDSTGDTIRIVSRACLVQFDGVEPVEHLWPLARTPRAIERVLEYIEASPGKQFESCRRPNASDRFIDRR